MKTKDEILENEIQKDEYGFFMWQPSFVNKAMNEYAKEVAIDFAEWIGDEINPFVIEKGKWIQSSGNSTSWTTKELFELYQQSKHQS